MISLSINITRRKNNLWFPITIQVTNVDGSRVGRMVTTLNNRGHPNNIKSIVSAIILIDDYPTASIVCNDNLFFSVTIHIHTTNSSPTVASWVCLEK